MLIRLQVHINMSTSIRGLGYKPKELSKLEEEGRLYSFGFRKRGKQRTSWQLLVLQQIGECLQHKVPILAPGYDFGSCQVGSTALFAFSSFFTQIEDPLLQMVQMSTPIPPVIARG